ncbi:MAG TPA: helicase, partial [Nitrospira sp.]|nr:helicase [Nitrospira sp.]
MTDYASFLASKRNRVEPSGITDPAPFDGSSLFPFQQDIVRWALRRGRAAIFADCGMGKTPMQLAWAQRVCEHTGGKVLILAPLAVSQQTVQEGVKFNVAVTSVRSQSEVTGPGVWITNYEMLHHFDPTAFDGVVLDESSILKAYTGKIRNQIIDAFADTPFRLACTATPSPNDYMELGNHAEFMGAMTRTEMLSMYFVHDGGETQKWRIKGHAEPEFWKWVCSWAVMIRRPSDLGYDDDGFTLPALDIVSDVVGDPSATRAETLSDRRKARRDSLGARVQSVADRVNTSEDPWLVWVDLNDEGDELERLIPGSVQVAGADSPEDKVERMLGFASGKYRVLITKPSIAGFGMNWQHCARMAFVGLSDSYEKYYQAIRRCWRFGQARPVTAYVVTSSSEGAI